jgi:hypothetical protein
MTDKVIIKNQVIITEMPEEDSLYELTFTGSAEDYGFSNETDYLTPEDAFESAEEVAKETDSTIVWEGYKPAWA